MFMLSQIKPLLQANAAELAQAKNDDVAV